MPMPDQRCHYRAQFLNMKYECSQKKTEAAVLPGQTIVPKNYLGGLLQQVHQARSFAFWHARRSFPALWHVISSSPSHGSFVSMSNWTDAISPLRFPKLS